jgi:hypothetical protein
MLTMNVSMPTESVGTQNADDFATQNISMLTASPNDIKCVGTLTASVMCVSTKN